MYIAGLSRLREAIALADELSKTRDPAAITCAQQFTGDCKTIYSGVSGWIYNDGSRKADHSMDWVIPFMIGLGAAPIVICLIALACLAIADCCENRKQKKTAKEELKADESEVMVVEEEKMPKEPLPTHIA